MSKALRMTRSELVWETRINEFSEKDWEKTVEWLKSFTEKEATTSWAREHITIYNAVKDLTWEQVYEDYKKWDNGDRDTTISYELISEGYGWNETHDSWVRKPEEDKPYKQYLGDFLQEMIREDNYNADVDNYEYADDYDEDIEFLED